MAAMTDHKAPRYRVVLFDMDGTVADCFEDILAATNHAMRRLGLPEHDLAAVKSFVGNGVDHLCRMAVGDRIELAEEARGYLAEHYAGSAAGKSRFYPGIVELLRDLRAGGTKLALVSNKVHALAVRAIEEMGGGDFFDAIQGETAELPRKPAPDMLLHVLARMGEKPDADSIAMVGDGPQDVLAGQSAGVRTIAATWGVATRPVLEALNPDEIVENAHDLRALLLDLARLNR
jgi:phosphoglycolate phosphatase